MKKYKKEVINNMNKSLMVLVSDSWGIGAELNNPTGNIYVDHLQKKLGFDEILNLADAGISNDSIYERVVTGVIESKDSFSFDKVFVLVGWTSPERRLFKFLDFHKKTILTDFNYIPGNIAQGTGELSLPENFFPSEDIKGIDQYCKLYNRYFWNVEESLDRWVYQMITLHRFLMSYNIKHLFFNNFYPYDSMYNFFKDFRGDTIFQSDVDKYFEPYGYSGDSYDFAKSKEGLLFSEPIKSGNKLMFDEKQQKLFSAISKKYIYPDTLLNVLRSKYENKEPPSMYLSSTKKDNPALCEGSHPNEFGHKVIADILYEHIKKHGMC
jgi:hypothetical protein